MRSMDFQPSAAILLREDVRVVAPKIPFVARVSSRIAQKDQEFSVKKPDILRELRYAAGGAVAVTAVSGLVLPAGSIDWILAIVGFVVFFAIARALRLSA
jgi:hypothetical protein